MLKTLLFHNLSRFLTISYYYRYYRNIESSVLLYFAMDTPEAFKARILSLYLQLYIHIIQYIQILLLFIIIYRYLETDLNFGFTIRWACRTKIKIA